MRWWANVQHPQPDSPCDTPPVPGPLCGRGDLSRAVRPVHSLKPMGQRAMIAFAHDAVTNFTSTFNSTFTRTFTRTGRGMGS